MWTLPKVSFRKITVHAHHLVTWREVVPSKPVVDVLVILDRSAHPVPTTLNMVNRQEFQDGLVTAYASWTTTTVVGKDFNLPQFPTLLVS
jgi:hypothetical protein